MSHSAPGRNPLRTLRALCSVALGFLTLAVFAQTASAITVTGSAPVGGSVPGLDLVSAKLDYDPAAGSSSLTVQTAAPSSGVSPAAIYALLGKKQGDQCVATGEGGGVLVYVMIWMPAGEGLQWILTDPVDSDQLSVQRDGTTVTATIAARASLQGLGFDCVQVQTKLPDVEGLADDQDVDAMNLFVGGATNTAPPVKFEIPVITDQDMDGIPDAKDKCPAEPGGATNGCLTLPDRLVIRLGAKRVAIDKMVAKTAATCPLKAKVKVTLKKKTLATGVVSVSNHGAFCRAYGEVKLKKSVKKKTKVKVTITATGMTSIAATVKR